MSYLRRMLVTSAPVKCLVSHTYPPVRFCIYCGTTVYKKEQLFRTLALEHIVPEGHGGTLLLPEASCARCEGITSAFEGFVMRRIFGPLRIHYNLPTKRRKSRPDTLPIDIERPNGTFETLEIALEDHPLIVSMVVMNLPSILVVSAAHIDNADQQVNVHFPRKKPFADQQLAQLSQKYGGRATVRTGIGGGELRLLLAKIGHCLSVATFGIAGFSPFLTEAILRKDATALKLYVGSGPKSVNEEGSMHCRSMHCISYRVVQRGRQHLIVWSITLFACLDFNSYEVVAGRLFHPMGKTGGASAVIALGGQGLPLLGYFGPSSHPQNPWL